ncbi:bacterial surface proteins containing Ig-like domains [Moorella thermoacetica Y72]|uniref:Bacterial surface proteins containing Ig-like domains n=1 Tax=Moorella thermoacetica Y72 TaxID=1325331 RepID=A0A0S6UHG9_NEOTH|nr:stalk domain-containing protein [Moorella thermoacetica]GAF27001.1 bacterial surface proteins containing Ig-like domains [Moorella thermoacetica Y72]
MQRIDTRLLPVTIIALLLCMATFLNTALAASPPAKQIILTPGSTEIWVDGEKATLPAAPYVSDGVLMVPLRRLADELGFTVQWQEGPPQSIVVNSGNLRAEMYPGTWVVFLTGSDYRAVILPAEVQQKDGLIFVPTAFFQDAFRVPMAESKGEKGVYLLGSDNQPPTAYFDVQEPVYAGEEVKYIDKSSDGDGDAIVERQWLNKKNIFPSPGVYSVTLKVKDSRGSWSKPYVREIKVLPRPAADVPRPGEIVENIMGQAENTLKPVKADSGPRLLFSDDPEYIEKPGILYRDKLKGEGRLYFWHDVNSPGSLKVYVLAINTSPREAEVNILKEGYGGPSNNVYLVARTAFTAYYHSQGQRRYTLKPGQILVLNPGAPAAVRYQVVHGIIDLKTSEEITVAFVAVPATVNVLEAYSQLGVLPRDGEHVRGTFAAADREMTIDLRGAKTGSILLADGSDDKYMAGADGITGSSVWNAGNYGMLYRLKIKSDKKTGVYLIPAGGSFGGTLIFNAGEVSVPLEGFISSPAQAVYLGTTVPEGITEMLFMSPGGSCLPVKLLFK